MSKLWRWLLPCYVWTIVMTLAGFVISVVWYKARDWVWYQGVLTCVAGVHANGVTRIWGRPNAQTLGWIQIYDSEFMRQCPDLRVHENVHVVQAFAGSLVGMLLVPLLFVAAGWSPLLGLVLGGFIGGVGFAATYGILFLYLYLKLGNKDWYAAYRANPFEEQAYTLQDKYLANPDTKPWGV